MTLRPAKARPATARPAKARPAHPLRLDAQLAAVTAALDRATRTQVALGEITARLTSLRDPDAVLQRTVEEAVRLLDAFGAALGLIDPAAGVIRWAYHAGMDPETTAALVELDIPVGRGIVGRAFEERRTVFTDDYPVDPQFAHLPDADDWISRTQVRSMVAAPLPGESGPLGILAVFSRRRNAFSRHDRSTFETLADQAAIALENARRIEEIDRSRADLARRAEVEQALRELGAELASLRDPDEVLRRVVDQAARLVDADAVALDVLNAEANRIEWAYDAGMDGTSVAELVRGGQDADQGLVGLAIETGEIAVTGEYLEDHGFRHLPEADAFMAENGIRSMVAAPLRGERVPLGVLDFYSRRPNAFGPDELRIIAAFAGQAAVALANARLIDELARSQEELQRKAATERSLAEIAARIAGAPDPEQVLQAVVDEARRLLASDSAHLTQLASAGDSLVTAVVADGTEPTASEWLRSITFPLGDDGLHARAVASGEVVWTDDSLRDREASMGPADLPAGRRVLRAVAVAPLTLPDGGVGGTLAISYATPRSIDADDRQLLATLADLASVAIVNSRLESDVRGRAADLAASEERARLARELHDSVTQALFSMTLQTRAAELLLDRDLDAAREKLASLRELQRDALAELRSLVFELRPSGIAEQGLVHALRTHAAAIEGRIGLPVTFVTTVDEATFEVSIDVAEALYRIAQEGLHNVVRHARASHVEVRLALADPDVTLAIVDDGAGFDPAAVGSGHVGIESIRARAERLGGEARIESRIGGGTRIEVRVPADAGARKA